jgi:nucleotide-binding universal stress UspA family protein
MSRILAAVDDTEAAGPVLATACAVARSLHLDVTALHVGDTAGASARAAQEHDVPLTVVPGETAEEIVAALADPDVVMVVLALHGLPGHHDPGHIAMSVATHSAKPVIVVPPGAPTRTDPRRILFPLDGTRGVSSAVRPWISMCVAAGLEVLAMHVFEPSTVPRFHDGPQDAQIWRDEFLARHCADLGLRLETRAGPTDDALLDLAEHADVDAIALGWHQDLSPDRARVVRRMLLSAYRPVVLIPLPSGRRDVDLRAGQQGEVLQVPRGSAGIRVGGSRG